MTAAIAPSFKSWLILSLLLAIFAIAPLCYPGYIQTHSGFTFLWNVADLRANLGSWRWTPHIAIDFDPLRSDGLLPYYLAALLPLEPGSAIKVVLGLGWLLGNAGMYLWLRRWLGPPGALVAALVYTYLPYQIATIYVRGAWGEALFWGGLPWAIWAAGEQINRRTAVIFLSVIGLIWLLLAWSQLGLTLWMFVFISLFLGVMYAYRAAWAILAGFCGVLLGTLSTLAVATAAPVFSPIPPFSDHFLYPSQLFSAYWGFGSSRPGWNDGMSFQLGLAAVGLALLGIILWQRQESSDPPTHRTDHRLIFFSGTAFVSLLLQFGFSASLWHVPVWSGSTLASSLTYPWQLLGWTGLCLSVLAGAALWLDKQLIRWPVIGSIIILIILSSYSYLSPQFIQVDPEMLTAPQAVLGTNQMTLLAHTFSVDINGNTAGLELGPTPLPLAVHGRAQPNQTLRLNVIWQPLKPLTEDWKFFVHLVDSKGQVLAQFDGQPLAGSYPTSQWIPGELIQDSYPLPLPSDAPPGPYQIFLGLYNEATGARLPVPGDTEGRIILNVE
jgi:hypothetical protein